MWTQVHLLLCKNHPKVQMLHWSGLSRELNQLRYVCLYVYVCIYIHTESDDGERGEIEREDLLEGMD